MKYFKQYEPTVRNKACVIYSDISITFLSKEQLELFCSEFLKSEDCPNFEIETVCGDSLELTKYILNIFDLPWANGATKIFQLLEKYYYNMEDTEVIENKE